MERELKRVLRTIDKGRCGTPIHLGDVWARIYRSGGLVFDKSNERVWLLDNDDKQRIEVFNSVVELLSIMKRLEAENDIFLVDSTSNSGDILVFYSKASDFVSGQLPNQYNLGEEIILDLNNASCKVISDNRVLVGEEVSQALYNPLLYYFSSEMFVGGGVSRYIKRNYMTEEQYNSIRALRISWWSLVVAILIALLSPVINLHISEEWGKRERVETKIDSLERQHIFNPECTVEQF